MQCRQVDINITFLRTIRSPYGSETIVEQQSHHTRSHDLAWPLPPTTIHPTCSSSSGVKSFLMLNVLRISSGVLPARTQERDNLYSHLNRVLNGFAPNYSSRFGFKSVSCPDPTLPEKKGLVTIRHPARPSDVSCLACEMTNHSTVSVISSAMWSHGTDNIPYNYGICTHVVTYNGMFVTPL